MPERDAATLLRLITEEIWNRRRYELVEMPGLEGTGRARYQASVDLTHGILRFSDGRAVERWGVSDSLTEMQQLGLLD